MAKAFTLLTDTHLRETEKEIELSRAMIDLGLMQRERGVYWRTG